MKKRCCTCKHALALFAFKSNRFKRDGLQSKCIECQKKYRRQHYLKNREKYILKASKWRKEFKTWWKNYKKNFKCSDCPEDHPACIDFHHVKSDKIENISTLVVECNREKLLAEIDKCIPLCANCHRKRHAAIAQW